MEFKLRNDYITLQQLLKVTDFISTGGEAKPFLAEAEILLNGEPENRRGKKLYRGDVLDINGTVVEIK